jgi:hypothetical protein
MALDWSAQSFSLPGELALDCPAMTMAEGTEEAPSRLSWKADMQSLKHWELVPRAGSWVGTGDKSIGS